MWRGGGRGGGGRGGRGRGRGWGEGGRGRIYLWIVKIHRFYVIVLIMTVILIHNNFKSNISTTTYSM